MLLRILLFVLVFFAFFFFFVFFTVAIDDSLLNRPGVTLGMAALSLARSLHPGWSGP